MTRDRGLGIVRTLHVQELQYIVAGTDSARGWLVGEPVITTTANAVAIANPSNLVEREVEVESGEWKDDATFKMLPTRRFKLASRRGCTAKRRKVHGRDCPRRLSLRR